MFLRSEVSLGSEVFACKAGVVSIHGPRALNSSASRRACCELLQSIAVNSAAERVRRRRTETRVLHLNLHSISGLLFGPSLCNHLVPKLADDKRLRLLNLIHEHLRDGAAKVDAGHVADERPRAARDRRQKRDGMPRN
jgi:hypothetical protein